MSCYQRSLAILAQIYLCLPTVKKKCAELNKSGKTTSGVYTIDPDGLGAFKSSVTKRQPVGGGQYFRGDWMARLTSIAAGPITRMALVIYMVSFGWDWTRYTVLQQQ